MNHRALAGRHSARSLSASAHATWNPRSAPMHLYREFLHRKTSRSIFRASDDDEAATANDGAPVESAIISMADSLIQRAKEAVVAGGLDQTFLTELEAELHQLADGVQTATKSADASESALLAAKEQFVRLQADFENFRKRSAMEKDTLKIAIKGDTVAELLPLIDNFELAQRQLKVETEGEKKIDGAYQGLYKQMVELFRGLGLEATPGVGEPFDPNVHDAIMREANEDVPDGTVLEEFRKGFKLADRLLRPAMVKVSYSETPSQVEVSVTTSESSE